MRQGLNIQRPGRPRLRQAGRWKIVSLALRGAAGRLWQVGGMKVVPLPTASVQAPMGVAVDWPRLPPSERLQLRQPRPACLDDGAGLASVWTVSGGSRGGFHGCGHAGGGELAIGRPARGMTSAGPGGMAAAYGLQDARGAGSSGAGSGMSGHIQGNRVASSEVTRLLRRIRSSPIRGCLVRMIASTRAVRVSRQTGRTIRRSASICPSTMRSSKPHRSGRVRRSIWCSAVCIRCVTCCAQMRRI